MSLQEQYDAAMFDFSRGGFAPTVEKLKQVLVQHEGRAARGEGDAAGQVSGTAMEEKGWWLRPKPV